MIEPLAHLGPIRVPIYGSQHLRAAGQACIEQQAFMAKFVTYFLYCLFQALEIRRCKNV